MKLLGKSLDARVLAGTLLLIGTALFLVAMTFGETLAPGYNAHDQPISDLGVIPETAVLFAFSLIVLGAIMLVSGFLLNSVSPSRLLTIIFVITGIGIVGVGIFNLNNGIHGLFALISFISINVLAIVMATKVSGPMRYISGLMGAIGLLGLILHLNELNGAIGPGGMERVIVYPALIWLLAYSGYLMSRSDREVKAA